jgi:hypothetical protein
VSTLKTVWNVGTPTGVAITTPYLPQELQRPTTGSLTFLHGPVADFSYHVHVIKLDRGASAWVPHAAPRGLVKEPEKEEEGRAITHPPMGSPHR